MKRICHLALLMSVLVLTLSCGRKSESASIGQPSVGLSHNAIYHWRTTFELDSTEVAFVQRHNIERIYVKMFDVATERNFLSGDYDPVPIATTKFVSAVPSGVEIVPVVYVTIEALRAMKDNETYFGEIIVERAMAMCNYNKCGKINELQIDCDWTSSTKKSYNRLCTAAAKLLKEQGKQLSVTIRLHQLDEDAPPADRGVLMLYNTGALKSPKSRNSILDIDDVRPYLKKRRYSLPLDYAYPTFGWGVKFKNGKFEAIVPEYSKAEGKGETIRRERASGAEILEVKMLVEQYCGKPANRNILYHLDDSQLKNYTDEEVLQIFAF